METDNNQLDYSELMIIFGNMFTDGYIPYSGPIYGYGLDDAREQARYARDIRMDE